MVPTKTKLQLSAALSLAALGLSACGGGATPSVPPSASLQQVAGSSTGRIVLTRLGAQRIGVQTEPVRGVPPPASPPVPKATRITATGATRVVARPPAPAPAPAAGGPTVVIPYSAVIYAPDGSTYAFTSPTPLVFT